MQTYRVSVVANYQAGADMSEMLERVASNGLESSGVVRFVGDVGIRPTLIASYEDVEGRTEDHARHLAVAIFKLESSRWPLPRPAALLAASPFVTGRAARGSALA